MKSFENNFFYKYIDIRYSAWAIYVYEVILYSSSLKIWFTLKYALFKYYFGCFKITFYPKIAHAE